MLIKQNSCAEHGALVISGCPMVEIRLHGAVGCPCTAVIDLSVGGIEQQLALGLIDGQSLAIVGLVARGLGQIACRHGSRAVDAGVRGKLVLLALLPDKRAKALVGTVVHGVIVLTRLVKIILDSKEFIGTDTGKHHPGDVIIKLIVRPVGAIALQEIIVQLAEDFPVPRVPCCLKGIEYGLKHLGVTPPASIAKHMAVGRRVIILVEEAVHHEVAHCCRKRCLACGILHQIELRPLSRRRRLVDG